MSSKGLPAAVAVAPHVGKAHPGDYFAGRIHQFGQSAREPEVAFDMRAQFGEPIGAGLALWDVGKRLGAGLQGAIDVSIFEFFGQEAGYGIGILAAKSVGPSIFEVNESGFSLRLTFRAVGGLSGQGSEENYKCR